MTDLSWAGIDARFVGSSASLLEVDAFLREPAVARLVVLNAQKACNRFGLDYSRHVEDLENEARTLIFLILTDPAASQSARRIVNGFPTALSIRFGDHVKTLIESSDWTGSRGMSTRIRRGRALAMHRARMVEELGRIPSDHEVLESYNTMVTAARSDAARQGALATELDLSPVEPAMLDPTLDIPAASHEDDLPLVSAEARPLLELVLQRCAAHGGNLALVARAWLDHFDAAPPYIATVAEIVAEVGLHESVVRGLLLQAQQVARDVLAEDFGITEDDWSG